MWLKVIIILLHNFWLVINCGVGKRQARILASEADRQEQINKAIGEASAIKAVAEARAKGLQVGFLCL